MTIGIEIAALHETPEEAACRHAAGWLRQGYVLEGIFPYSTADGDILFWRVRLKHPNGDKKFPAIHWTGERFEKGERPPPAEGKPLYRLPELLASTGPVVIGVEGETKADALIALGGMATTTGGANTVHLADLTALQGRMVLFWRDNDAAGLQCAREITRRLHALYVHVEWIDVTALDLQEGGDVIDWLAMHPGATWQDVLMLPRLSALDLGEAPPSQATADARAVAERRPHREPAQPRQRPVPEPLRRPLSRARPYPVEALGEVLGGAAARIREVVQSPVGLCGQSLLSAASLAVQALADVEIDGRREPLSLWHLSIGESGERKSATDAAALRPHREWERALADDFARDLAAYDSEAGAYKAAVRRIENKGEPAEVRAARQELGPAPLRPLEPWLLLNEPTLEGLQRLYQRGRPSIGLFNDDGGDFIHGHAMGNDNRAKSIAGLSRLWDCGEFSRSRGGDGTSKWYGRRLAMHVMIQPVIAEQVLSDRLLTEQGFLARCLLSWPESTIGTREYVAEDLGDDPAMRRYAERMRALLCMPAVTRPASRNELTPRTLVLVPDAKAYWIEVANSIERDMRGDFQGIRPWASKAGAQILRIAGVLSLVDDNRADVIPLEKVERATSLMQHYLHEAARINGTAIVPRRIEDAEALIQWCRRTRRSWLYSADVLRFGPGAIRTRDAFLAAMMLLETTGWVEKEQRGVMLDGKLRARAWPLRAEVLG
ncbi:MAG: DUF3987 domain-containing protein [Pseudomonadota bacterium]